MMVELEEVNNTGTYNRRSFSIDSILYRGIHQANKSPSPEKQIRIPKKGERFFEHSPESRHNATLQRAHDRLIGLSQDSIENNTTCSCVICNEYEVVDTRDIFNRQKKSDFDCQTIIKNDSNWYECKKSAHCNKRRRTIFTIYQLERLECEFQQQQYLVGHERRYLAKDLGLNEVQVKVWFQNRRIKWRKSSTHQSIDMLPMENSI